MSCSSNQGTVGIICHSKEKLYDRFDWKVENFSSLSTEVNHCYHSPLFDFAECSWFLDLFANGVYGYYGKITLYIVTKNRDTPKHIHYELGVKTVKGNVEKLINKCATFGEKGFSGWGIEDALKRSELLRRKSELLPTDCLTITAIMSTNAPQFLGDTLDVSIQTEVDIIAMEGMQPVTGGEKALEDIGKLSISGDNSDVTVKVRDVEFKAHRAILAARTPVLAAMFEHDTAEKASNEIKITDCEPGIFKEFLHYIYTGTVEYLTVQNVFALYGVADKYLTHDLKLQCLTYIQETLCVATFCDTAKLAVAYGEEKLLQLAIEFASKNIRLIIRSVEWQNFILEHTVAANEILIKSLGSP